MTQYPLSQKRACTCNILATFTYDGNGNAKARTVAVSGSPTYQHEYTYDAEDRLTQVRKDNVTTLGTYAYDGLGRRVKAVEGATTTYFVYSGLSLVHTVAGSSTTRYVYASGLLVARVAGTTTTYVHQDALGSTRAVSNGYGNWAYVAQYQPFGREYGTQGSWSSLKYTGQWRDGSTGLDYLYRRFYDPDLGRFLSQDPILGQLSDPQTLSRYPYVVNNPLKYADPTGLNHGLRPGENKCDAMLTIWNNNNPYGGNRVDCDYVEWIGETYPAWDGIMMAVGFIPIVGDIAATAYFLAKDAIDCLNGRCDWGMIGADAAGILPGLPNLGGAARIARGVGQLGGGALVGRTANRVDDILDGARGFRAFTARNYRHNLEVLTGLRPGREFHADHIFPRHFESQFARVGINIHDPHYLTWARAGDHAGWSARYNQEWQFFLSQPRYKDEILLFGKETAGRYGLDAFF